MKWRGIPGWPDYQVSSNGDVRRVRQASNGCVGPLKPWARESGHLTVTLHSNGKSWPVHVHHLVALAFIGPRPSGRHQAAHNDGDPANNRLRNIRWATPKENTADRRKHGRDTIGEKHGMAKLTVGQVIEIRRRHAEGETQTSLGVEFGVTQGHVWHIVRGNAWKAALAATGAGPLFQTRSAG